MTLQFVTASGLASAATDENSAFIQRNYIFSAMKKEIAFQKMNPQQAAAEMKKAALGVCNQGLSVDSEPSEFFLGFLNRAIGVE